MERFHVLSSKTDELYNLLWHCFRAILNFKIYFMADTNNRYALITGATEGIGYELAKLFAEDGYNLIIVARTEEALQQRAAEFSQHGIQVIPIVKDLFQPNAAFELYDEVKARMF